MDKTVEPMTDDAELAKVLEGMQDAPIQSAPAPTQDQGLAFEPTTPAMPTDPVQTPAPLDPIEPVISPVDNSSNTPSTQVTDPGLESIKKDALAELRPLVDKLDLPADEKFDTLLLIIRSTDDKTLVQSAYDAAKSITDDSKRAEALLDVVKEIDYFSNPAAGQPQL
ncbi:MAG: hypothetical protein ABIQ64_01125 [Candidatus Saccharimonadales bacterium]